MVLARVGNHWIPIYRNLYKGFSARPVQITPPNNPPRSSNHPAVRTSKIKAQSTSPANFADK